MDVIAICLAAFGGVCVFASWIALAIIGDERDENDSIGYWIDIWIFSSLITGTRNIYRGIMAGISNRKAQGFPLVVLFIVGLIFVTASAIIHIYSQF